MATNLAAASVPGTANDESNATVSPPTTDAKTDNAVPSDELPSAETRRKAEELPVLDREGNSHAFKSLYQGPNSASRVLSCQEFLRALCESVRPEDLQRLPVSTSIAIVGCGDPRLIDFYATETKCPYPIYADPTRKLYDEFGMVMSFAMGARPAYFRQSMTSLIASSFVQGFKNLSNGLILKGGESRQNGGEFLFEGGEEKEMKWCHRMTNTRDHAGIPELKRVLDSEGKVLGTHA
ncbi:hypothetical protein N7492_009131 [Penicillium capsulatum]|uniref:Uncharacterized protein n=1 Tax=Penicillium capsulatum TaxID=69766 RepID=A0A9W9LHL5_9EURO|nr:hypothetical protein N7492_009131 [Penicillium capsulatum]KAJ6106530.1 hypothetical protein N7512_010047 [Penicillium capsulatum]